MKRAMMFIAGLMLIGAGDSSSQKEKGSAVKPTLQGDALARPGTPNS